MRKILFVYHVSSIGGGSYCLLNILKSLDRTVVKPYVLLCNNGPLVDEIRKLDIDVHFLLEMRTVPYNSSTLTIGSLLNAYHIIHSFKAFKDIVSKLDVDAVYLNTMMLYPYLKQAKELGKKTIIHIREHWPEGEHKWQRKQAIEHIKKYADYIVAINNYSATMMEERAKDATIVYDWIDMESRDDHISLSTVLGENDKELKVYLYTGGLQQIKGALEIIQTFSSKIKDPNARLLALGLQKPSEICGIKGVLKKALNHLGYKTYSQQLFELVNRDSRIVCVKGTYMITSIIKQCYCNLSYFTIPHANLALAESIILNTPTIAAETEESKEYSLNGSLACLYPLKDLNGFISQIDCLTKNYSFIKQRLKNDSHIVKQMFDTEMNAKNLNQLLKNI